MTSKSRISRLRLALVGGALTIALTSPSAVSLAQDRVAPPPVAEIAAALDLSADQTPAFTRILEAHIAKTEALLARHGVDPSAGRPSRQTLRVLRADMKQNQQALRAELAAILTPDQLSRLEAMRARAPRP